MTGSHTANDPKAVTLSRVPKGTVPNTSRYPATARTKPVTMAAISAQALMRHQNQRSSSTMPGPVPIRIRKRNTSPTLVM